MKLLSLEIPLEDDIKGISDMIEGRVINMASRKNIADLPSFLRIYFIASPVVPVIVFNEVPVDLYLTAFINRCLPFDDGSDPHLIRMAVLGDGVCLNVVWISIPVAIWVSALLSKYSVTDLSFLTNTAKTALFQIGSLEEPQP